MHDLQGDHDMKNKVKGGNMQKKRRGYGKPKRMASRCCPCFAVSSIARRIGRCLFVSCYPVMQCFRLDDHRHQHDHHKHFHSFWILYHFLFLRFGPITSFWVCTMLMKKRSCYMILWRIYLCKDLMISSCLDFWLQYLHSPICLLSW